MRPRCYARSFAPCILLALMLVLLSACGGAAATPAPAAHSPRAAGGTG